MAKTKVSGEEHAFNTKKIKIKEAKVVNIGSDVGSHGEKEMKPGHLGKMEKHRK